MIYSYNKNQRDAIFPNFILVKKSTCFGQTYCPSTGVLIPYSQHTATGTRDADKELARPTFRHILFDGENIPFDTSLVIYIYIYIYI